MVVFLYGRLARQSEENHRAHGFEIPICLLSTPAVKQVWCTRLEHNVLERNNRVLKQHCTKGTGNPMSKSIDMEWVLVNRTAQMQAFRGTNPRGLSSCSNLKECGSYAKSPSNVSFYPP